MVDVATPLPPRSASGLPLEVAVLCDAESSNLTVITSTPEFAFMCGVHPRGFGFLDWIADPQDFLIWVQDHLNGASATSMLCMPSPRRKITWQSPLARQLGVEIEAVCSLSFRESDMEVVDDIETLPVRFVFSKVRRNRMRTQRAATGVPQQGPSLEGSREGPRERRRRIGTRSSGSSQ
eukprot:gnl/TRDRNA2_/TRDRNA2_69958_c0_seq1.p1 gnl/TRDRNA2_/TRDRNA2_69958_c0~~gnl/TRDRNA2_/TRDRNA2_69958_c0_seq1.p1  ORF type:complete len:204 (+),score=6.83 gnl/TRDRNA2_/TRDRNA2_69958_c0_seq1:77-613(+)